MTDRVTCGQCVYWDRGKSAGRCRCHPPLEVEDNTRWPWTNPDDWCGQAMPKDSGSTQPVHEAAQRVCLAWSQWLLERKSADMPQGLSAFERGDWQAGGGVGEDAAMSYVEPPGYDATEHSLYECRRQLTEARAAYADKETQYLATCDVIAQADVVLTTLRRELVEARAALREMPEPFADADAWVTWAGRHAAALKAAREAK